MKQMYSLNTQLAYFKYSLSGKDLLVNVTWFKLDTGDPLYPVAKPFARKEIDQFNAFIKNNPLNFPGTAFVQEYSKNLIILNSRDKEALHLFIVVASELDFCPDITNTAFNTIL